MASSSERRGEKLKVFVSYARDDLDFADQLVSALETFDFDLLIDRQGISAGEDWQRRLGALVAEADTVVFLLSPSAAQSKMCAWEIAETDRLSKRLLPVVIKPLGATPVAERFRELNYIFFYPEPRVPGSGFGRGLTALVQALNTDLEWVREHTRLAQRAAEWQAGGQSENRLLSGDDVTAARAWLARRPPKAPAPTELHLDFIRASEEAQTARESTERQRLREMAAAQAAREKAQNERAAALVRLRRNTLLGGGIALVLAIAAGTFGWIAEVQRREAETQQQRAEEQTRAARANESRALAALSEIAANQHRYVDAVKLALAAWPRSPGGNRPEYRAVISALGRAERLQKQTIPSLRHEGVVEGAAFNGDESRILTWSEDGTARLWDAATGQEVVPSLRHEGIVKGAAFDGDESRILTWSWDDTAHLWDAATGKELLPPLRHGALMLGAALNGDESRILTWSNDGTARLWDAATGKELLPLPRHEGTVEAAFNDNGSRILTWSQEGAARLWEAATGKEVLPPLRHEGVVEGAAFNGDESRILTWSDDGTARLWDAATGKEVLRPLRHEERVLGAAFNRDESRILTRSRDGTARLWDAATGKEILPPLRHEESVGGFEVTDDKGSVDGAVFNGDESRILTWSGDGTARLWDAATGKEILPPLRHRSIVDGAVFNRDESLILTWSYDDTARLWDTATGQEVLPPLHHDDDVWGAVFNGDESRILTWSQDGTARLWDAATGQEVVTPLRHEADVWGAAFNGDESRILTWSQDGTARLWDISRLPRGHLIDIACAMLPDHDTSELKDRYGIAITEPICGPDTPAPVWTELVD